MLTNINRDTKFNSFEKFYKTKHAIVGLFSVGLFICLIGFIGTVIYFNHLTHESSKISDRELKQKVLHFAGDDLINHENSDVLSEYDKSENSLIVDPKHVNPNVIKALTSSEDTMFYKHKGILPKALVRAMIQDVFNLDQSTGGSTIQQLVKTKCYQVKTYSRKANELILAMRLENLLSKMKSSIHI